MVAPMQPARPAPILHEIPGNAAPSGAIVEMVTAADGRRLRTARWPAITGQAKGTICLFQGRSEFIEKYFEVIADLRARGFAVATLDWRGQGGSDRLMPDHRRGHVDDFSDYRLDVDVFMRRVALSDCPPPFFALAHSMGAAVLFDMLSDRPLWFERFVAVGPMIGLPDLAPGSRLLALALRGLGMGRWKVPFMSLRAVQLSPFAGNPVTLDPARYGRAADVIRAAPRLGIGAPTVGWVDEAFRVMERLGDPDFGQRWRTPTLIVAAGVDRVVSTEAAEAFGRSLRVTRTITIPGALHELMNERDQVRDLFFAAFDAFVPGTQGA